jgi:hypothetical protein
MMLRKDDGEYPPTLEEWRVMTRHATRNLTDDPIGAHMRRRVLSAAIPEEPWRLPNTIVDGERTVEQAASLRGRKAMRVQKVLHPPTMLPRRETNTVAIYGYERRLAS